MNAAVTPGLATEDFVTAVFCEVHADGRLDIVLCGHPPPLRLRAGCPPQEVGVSVCPPIGLGVDPVVDSTVLECDDRLLLYTDGLIEARGRDGAFFDLLGAATGLAGPGPASTHALDASIEQLMEQVREHVGGRLTDDVAALLVQPVDERALTRPDVVSVVELAAVRGDSLP